MNSQIIRIAENAHEFFLQYPKAIANFKIQIDGKTVPELFHFAHEHMSKERNEHSEAELSAKDVKSTIRELGKSLRETAYALEKGVNAVLDLEGREGEEVDFVRGADFALSLEEFVVQLTRFENIIKQNPSYERSFTKFKQELSAYKTAAAQIGDAKIVADTEKTRVSRHSRSLRADHRSIAHDDQTLFNEN